MITVHLKEYGANPSQKGGPGTGNYPHKKYFEFEENNDPYLRGNIPLKKFEFVRRDVKTWLINTLSDKISSIEYEAINRYENSDFIELNSQLRHGGISPFNQQLSENLGSAISKNRINRNMMLFRGAPSGLTDNLNIGDIFIDKGFVSVSPLRKVGISFTNNFQDNQGVLIKIQANKGQNAVRGSLGDFEVILPRGTKFRVLAKGRDLIYKDPYEEWWVKTVTLEVIK